MQQSFQAIGMNEANESQTLTVVRALRDDVRQLRRTVVTIGALVLTGELVVLLLLLLAR